MAKRLIVAHGGDVVAESRGLGCGSRFTVRLPRIPGAAARGAADTGATPRGSALPPRARGRRQQRRRRDAVGLPSASSVTRCASRSTGMRRSRSRADSYPPSLPRSSRIARASSGYEVIEQMRQIAGCERVPVVAVTGYARESDRARTLEAGFSAHMAKPIDITRLGSIVEEMIRAAPAALPLEAHGP